MLSISKPIKGAGRADYYLNLAQEDYYLGGKEPPGFWLGAAANDFGLGGTVVGDEFRKLLSGFSPEGETRLVHNAGSTERRSGWDLTWSVPKSVSVAWSQASPETRASIELCVREAAKRGVAYLESLGVVSRRGRDGVIHEKAKLLFAAFEHSTSRAQDPQLHVHTILINLGIRPDGSTGTLDPRLLYRHQLAAGALFRAELAARLEQTLGLRARREGRCFELMGVPAALIEAFSKRRAQIEARLQELGLSSAAAAEKAALDTRPDKENLSREDLFPRWQEVGRAHQWSTQELEWVTQHKHPPRDHAHELVEATDRGLFALTRDTSHFSARQLTQSLAEEAQGRGLDADAVLNLRSQLLESERVISLQAFAGEAQWTTPQMLELERQVLSTAEAMRGAELPLPHSETIIADVLRQCPHLSEQQRKALHHVTSSAHGLRLVTGMAGTGKSTLFKAAKLAWEAEGRTVSAVCLAAKAALGLSEASGIPTQTVQRLLTDMERGWHTLDANSVLLVDEAAMVGTRQMKALLDHCHKAHATLVLCGDARQLQSIEAGGVFRELSERFGSASLTEIHRQREVWARDAVMAFANGQAPAALRAFSDHGLLEIEEEPAQALGHLLSAWRETTTTTLDSTVVLANRCSDVQVINCGVQDARLKGGDLRGEPVRLAEGDFYVGDQILFTKNSMTLGVCNGQRAIITDLSDGQVTARLEGADDVSFSWRNYPHFQLAYALTTHKAQGLTVERSFVYADATAESLEAAYVQASRARGICSIHATAENAEHLEAALGRSRPKLMATTLLPEERQMPSLRLELSY